MEQSGKKNFETSVSVPCVVLGPLMHKHHISLSFHIKMLRFYYQMFASSNDIVTYIIKLACVSGNSPIGIICLTCAINIMLISTIM